MEVAVIILNYNSSADCKKCVSFLKRQQQVELEIVVVDNNSRPAEKTAVEQLCQGEGCTFIPVRENQGYNAGNNIGLRYAAKKGYKYALIANPDMEFPQTDYASKMVQTMEEDEDIVVLGTDIIGADGIHQNPMKPDGGWTSSFSWLTVLFKKKLEDAYDFIDNFQVNHYCGKVGGCCLMVRISFIRELGYFDENVFLYCEEAILAKQVEQANKRMYYQANVQAVHRHIKSEKGNPIPRLKVWMKSRLYFERKYNYGGAIPHLLKIIGWKSYLFVLCVIKRIRS